MGFSKEALKFLKGLEKNNKREWFQPRKEIFDRELYAPLVGLVESINDSFRKVAPEYATEPKTSIYRIYRDTRFSEDKTPYKTHVAALFARKGLPLRPSACFYFHFSPKETLMAGGAYMADASTLLAMRRHIAGNVPEFRKILASKRLRKACGELLGDTLQRAPKGFAPDQEGIELIKRKQWWFHRQLPAEAALADNLASEVFKTFEVMIPVVEFLNAPLTIQSKRTLKM